MSGRRRGWAWLRNRRWAWLRGRGWAWLRVVGGLAILGVLVWRIGTGAFLDGLGRVDRGGVVGALVIGLATTVCCAGRWVLVARRLGLRLALPAAVAAYYRSLFLNGVLPAGVLGDVHRAVHHGRESGDVARGVRAVVLERAAGQVVVVAAALAVVVAQPSAVPVPLRGPAMVTGLVIAAAAACLAAAVIVRRRARSRSQEDARSETGRLMRGSAQGPAINLASNSAPMPEHGPATNLASNSAPMLEHGPVSESGRGSVLGSAPRSPVGVGRWRRGVAVVVGDVRAGLLSWRSSLGVAGLSVGAFVGHLALFVVATRVAGVAAPVGVLVPLMVLALLAMGVPVNVGGWGPREGATALLFAGAGLGAAQGVSVAVVYGVLSFAASLPGAGVLVVRGLAAARTKLRSIPPQPDGNNAMTVNDAGSHDAVVEELPRRAVAGGAVVERVVETRLPTVHGVFRAVGYLDRGGTEQVALVRGEVAGAGTLVRVHSECLTGDAFGSIHCECGDQLGAALAAIAEEGAGVLVYVRGHEGRGIGLLAKLKAMRLQEDGLDTVEANLALGLPVDARDYHVAAAILRDLGAEEVRLMSNNPHKVEQLRRYGVGVGEQVPLLVPPNDENIRYLRAKRERLDHLLPHLDRVTG